MEVSHDVQEMFNATTELVALDKKLKTTAVSDDIKLKFYSLYKQAVIGKCNVPKPSVFNIMGTAKWNAWSELGTMDKHTAMCKYCELYLKVSGM